MSVIVVGGDLRERRPASTVLLAGQAVHQGVAVPLTPRAFGLPINSPPADAALTPMKPGSANRRDGGDAVREAASASIAAVVHLLPGHSGPMIAFAPPSVSSEGQPT